MKKLILLLTLTMMFGQYGKDFEDMSDSEKYMVYNSHKKSIQTAVTVSFFVPTAGHAYAGEWLRGFLFYIPVGLTTVLMIQKPGEQILEIIISASVMHLWECIDSGRITKKYNNNLYKEIFGKEPPSFSLNLQPTYQGANLTLAYKFD